MRFGRFWTTRLDRRDHHGHAAPVHDGASLDFHRFTEFLKNPIEDVNGSFFVEPFTSAKQHGELDLATFSQKTYRTLELDRSVMGVGFGPNSNLFEVVRVGRGGLFCPLLAIILELAIVHDPADRRALRGRDLDKIEPGLPGKSQSLI